MASTAFVDQWLGAWNAHDLDAICAHYRDDVTFRSPNVAAITGEPSGVLRGIGPLRAYFAAALARVPDLRFTAQDVFAGAGSVAIGYRSVGGRRAVEVMALDDDGKVFDVRCHYADAAPVDRYGSTKGLDPLPIISQVLVHGDVVHTCGVTADPSGDVAEQTRNVLARIDHLLAKAGTDKSRLLTAQVWLRDMADFEAHNAAWNEWVDPDAPPVRACVEAPLWQPGLLVEVMVSAARA